MSKEASQALYFECGTGISGDMAVAALLDLGADEKVLKEALHSLPLNGFSVRVSRVKKAGLSVLDFDVVLDEEHENHDHDMKYLYGKEQESVRSHHGHHKHHEHRGLTEILEIIEQADMTQGAKYIARRIVRILASAEAKAHGVSEEEVHFHEVGAVDSIVDIISAAVCLDNLGIKDCIIPVLSEGTGSIRCQHGILSVPVPAVLNIVSDNNLMLSITDTIGELVTPTGAAIAAAVKTKESLPERFLVKKIGMGAGKRTYDRPSILRIMLIEEQTEGKDTVYKLESNIDDCTGEGFGYVMSRLFDAGARDVYYTPIYMKKNRPAYQINVICKEDQIEELEQIIFEETTTIGIRRQQMERTILNRQSSTIMTSLGEAKIKVCKLGTISRCYPEYESVASLCKTSGKPFQEVFTLIEREANDQVR